MYASVHTAVERTEIWSDGVVAFDRCRAHSTSLPDLTEAPPTGPMPTASEE